MECDSRESDVLQLDGRQPFGVGGRRLCFTHPTDVSKCVKVLRHDAGRTIRGKGSGIIPAQLRRSYNNNTDEHQTLDALFRRMGPTMSEHLPISHGFVRTDLGSGLVLDLVRDTDGQISRSLRELLSTGHELSSFRPAFDQFGAFLKEHRVQTRSLLDHNLAMQNKGNGDWKVFLIDGFGDPAWLPVSRWLKPVGLRKIRRRLTSAWTRFESFTRQGGVTPELIAESTWGQGFLNHRGE